MRQSSFLLHMTAAIASMATIGLGATRVAAQNYAPPAGAILDLSGLSVMETPARYLVSFKAPNSAATKISFVFRDDPGFLQFSNVSLIDVTTGGANLLSNGDFSQGVDGWTYNNIDDVALGGSVISSCAGPGACWHDGAVQGYDELSQSVTMSGGDEYQLAFYATNVGGPNVWSSVSTNGQPDSNGNGADILAYVAGIDGPYPHLPPITAPTHLPRATAPELSTWAMIVVGFVGLGVAGRSGASRRRTPTNA